jgi:hypothetical protein
VLLLQPVRKLPDVITPRYLVALLDVLEGEQLAVTMAHVTHAEVDAGAVSSGAQHQTLHGLGHPDLLDVWHFCGPRIYPLGGRLTVVAAIPTSTMILPIPASDGGHSLISSAYIIVIFHGRIIIPVIATSVDGGCIPVIYLVKVLRHPVLATVLILSLSRQVVRDLPSEADTGHGVEDDCIRYVISYSHDSPIQAGLNPVDFLSIP